MPERKTLTYIDPMAEMIAQIRQEERNGAKIDFVVAMLRGGEPDEKIAKYAWLDIEKVREARAVWEDMTKGESEQKSRAMITRIGECYWLRGSNSKQKQMAKRIEKMEIPHDRKRYLLQMLGYDPGKEKEKMSYDIHLNDPVTKQTLELDDPHFMRGGTYVVGGTKELCLNITYNYACVFRRPEVLGEGGIRSIYGKTGAESIPVLQKAIEALSDEVDPDYWKPAEGNVKKSLYQLLSMARMRPDGVWDGD